MIAKTIVILSIIAATVGLVPNALASSTCKGGTGEEYCLGYHAGATLADKDSEKGNVDVNQHHCNNTAQYCDGSTRGYDDEANFLS
jgi:hypothetical protein